MAARVELEVVVRQHARRHTSLTRRLTRTGKDADQAIADTVAKASEIAHRFPRLRARLDTPAADYNAAPEQTFENGLHVILTGLEPKARQ